MTTFDRFEREIPRLMDDIAPTHLPDYLDDLLQQTASTRQRPAWSLPERWLPMGVMAQTQQARNVPWRPIVFLAILGLLIAASVAVIGSAQPQPLPAPFGPAGNGEVVFSSLDGDIVRVDQATGETTILVGGDESDFDSAPWFANDGTKFAFDRRTTSTDVSTSLVVADADGSNVRVLIPPASPIRWFEWSPTGDRMVVLRDGDPIGQIRFVDAEDGSESMIDVGFDVRAASFRPGSDELILAGAGAYYRVGTDGTGLQTIVEDDESLDQYNISPNGTLLAYATWGSGGDGRIHVVDIDSRAVVAEGFDPGVEYNDLLPVFLPDGESVLIERHDGPGWKPTILPIDGSPPVRLGDYHPSSTGGAGMTISPDGSSLIATYRDDGTTWRLDTATGEGEPLDWPVPGEERVTWQRRAP
jgi:WD40 repeat protein